MTEEPARRLRPMAMGRPVGEMGMVRRMVGSDWSMMTMAVVETGTDSVVGDP